MSGETCDAVVAGHICLDIIPEFQRPAVLAPGQLFKVGPALMATGGAVSNTGIALHRLGAKVRLMGKVGDDLFGDAILKIVRSQGEGLADGMVIAQGQASSYSVVVNPPGVDRTFLHCPATNDTFSADDIREEVVRQGRLFHFGYPPLMKRMYADGGEELTNLYSRVKKLGVTTSMDMSLPDPESDAGQAPWSSILSKVLSHVDLFLPSIEELLLMIDRPRFDALRSGRPLASVVTDHDLSFAAQKLIGWGAAIVVIKLGENGLYLHATSDVARLRNIGACQLDVQQWAGRRMVSPCFKTQVVGTTGAGDCTIAGFLHAILRGESPESAATAATAVGAFSVEVADATSGVKPWAEVQARLTRGWERLPTALHLPNFIPSPAGVLVRK